MQSWRDSVIWLKNSPAGWLLQNLNLSKDKMLEILDSGGWDGVIWTSSSEYCENLLIYFERKLNMAEGRISQMIIDVVILIKEMKSNKLIHD